MPATPFEIGGRSPSFSLGRMKQNFRYGRSTARWGCWYRLMRRQRFSEFQMNSQALARLRDTTVPSLATGPACERELVNLDGKAAAEREVMRVGDSVPTAATSVLTRQPAGT
jgi:hypothetical protein